MSDEESAIDKIYKIEEDIEYIKQYQILMDNNLKLLHNKLNKIEKMMTQMMESGVGKPSPQVTVTPGTPPPPRPKNRELSDKLVIGKIKTFGFIVNKTQQPIEDIEVNVYDQDGNVVKRRKTDSDGYWEVRLPAGKYGVEYIQKGYRPINRTISLENSMKSFEVK
jgi:hypothetical protein